MTTDPGDLVLDPTCGSGTTAYVAEQWGRRWITLDTSRIALNIAKTRLMTAVFPDYHLYSDVQVETTEKGGQIVKTKKLKGFILMATVEAPVYSGGSLSVKLSIAMATYPDKSIQASFSPKLTQSNTPSTDTKSEDSLFKLCAESAIDSFLKVTSIM